MEKQQEYKIYNEAIEFFGDLSQKVMVIEEMSELTKELCKDLRDRGNVENIADELADVEITLAQLKMIYNIHIYSRSKASFGKKFCLKKYLFTEVEK